MMFSLAATGARPFHGVPLLGLAQFSLNGSLGSTAPVRRLRIRTLAVPKAERRLPKQTSLPEGEGSDVSFEHQLTSDDQS